MPYGVYMDLRMFLQLGIASVLGSIKYLITVLGYRSYSEWI